MTPSAQPAPELAEFANIDADREAAWRMGELSWKLDEHQLEIYELFREWNTRRQTPEYAADCVAAGATLDDVWTEELARRFGKTVGKIVLLEEEAIQRPGAVLTYGTAFQKDIGDIIVPLANQLNADAPDDVRPKYQRSKGAGHEGLYFPEDGPARGSVIKLVGVDEHPDALRGRFSDGIVLSEAGFMKRLEDIVRAVLLPQFQRRPWAFLALESSTPKVVDHDFSRVFVPDAKLRGAYQRRTIDANKAISELERERAIRQAGGRGHPTCEREYFCEQTRDPDSTIVPEFDAARHVVAPGPVPTHAHCYVALDPGIRDLLAIVWAYWDARRAKLVVQRSWAKGNASTSEVADVIKRTERELWNGGEDGRGQRLQYQDGMRAKDNPYMRVSDTDARLIHDMRHEHGIAIVPTAKDDAEAQLFALRDAFKNGKIEIWADSGPLESHVASATWNDKRTDWVRSELNGHADCLAALIYLWRNVMRNRDPYPPSVPVPGDMVFTREDTRRLREPQNVRALNDVMGRGGMRVRLKGRQR